MPAVKTKKIPTPKRLEQCLKKHLGLSDHSNARAYLDHFVFSVTGSDLTFTLLEKVSIVFKTKKINMTAQYEQGSCSTCNVGEKTWVDIDVIDPTYPDHL